MTTQTATIPLIADEDLPTDFLEKVEQLQTHTIGTGSIERAFCPIAAAVTRVKTSVPDAVSLVDPRQCTLYLATTCGLTAHHHPCLFCDREAPEWSIIRQSVQLERTRGRSTRPTDHTVPTR